MTRGYGASLGRTSCPYSGRGTSMCHWRHTPGPRRPRAAYGSQLRLESGPSLRLRRTHGVCDLLFRRSTACWRHGRRIPVGALRAGCVGSPAPFHGRMYGLTGSCRNRPALVPLAPRAGPARLRGRSVDRKASRRRVGSGVSWQRPWMAAVASAYRDVRPSGCDASGPPRLQPEPTTTGASALAAAVVSVVSALAEQQPQRTPKTWWAGGVAAAAMDGRGSECVQGCTPERLRCLRSTTAPAGADHDRRFRTCFVIAPLAPGCCGRRVRRPRCRLSHRRHAATPAGYRLCP